MKLISTQYYEETQWVHLCNVHRNLILVTFPVGSNVTDEPLSNWLNKPLSVFHV